MVHNNSRKILAASSGNVSATGGKNSKLLGRTSVESHNPEPDYAILAGFDQSSELIAPIPQFAVLKYGENLQLLFNINCQVQHLIDFFKAKCSNFLANVDAKDLDVCDFDGSPKNINRDRLMRKRLASDFLRPREVYILIEMKPLASNGETGAVKNNQQLFESRPLLTNSELVTPSFLAKLSPKQAKNSRKSSVSGPIGHQNNIHSGHQSNGKQKQPRTIAH